MKTVFKVALLLALVSATQLSAKPKFKYRPMPFSGIPAEYQGIYGVAGKKCQGDSDGNMVLAADAISYLDSTGAVDLKAIVQSVIKSADGTIVVLSEYQGRQERWLEMDGFSLAADGNGLERVTAADKEKPSSSISYVRCSATEPKR